MSFLLMMPVCWSVNQGSVALDVGLFFCNISVLVLRRRREDALYKVCFFSQISQNLSHFVATHPTLSC